MLAVDMYGGECTYVKAHALQRLTLNNDLGFSKKSFEKRSISSHSLNCCGDDLIRSNTPG